MILLGVIVMAVLAIMWHQKRLNFNKKPAAQSAAQLPVAQPAAQPATQPAAMVAQPAAQPVAQPAAMVAQPAAQLPATSKCSLDSQCASGACAHATGAADAPLECCAGEKINYSGNSYCKNMPRGSACWIDSMCTNGFCRGNAAGWRLGQCSGNLAAGAPCQSNRECSNGACGREGSAVGSTCCIGGMTFNYAGVDYCKWV